MVLTCARQAKSAKFAIEAAISAGSVEGNVPAAAGFTGCGDVGITARSASNGSGTSLIAGLGVQEVASWLRERAGEQVGGRAGRIGVGCVGVFLSIHLRWRRNVWALLGHALDMFGACGSNSSGMICGYIGYYMVMVHENDLASRFCCRSLVVVGVGGWVVLVVGLVGLPIRSHYWLDFVFFRYCLDLGTRLV